MKISHLDHLVLTVADIRSACDFYTQVLGMREETFAGHRTALVFGNQKINLHQKGKEFEPKATFPTPGSADLCFIVETPLDEVILCLQKFGIELLEKNVVRSGAMGRIRSVYFRDPDGNLIELSNYIA